MNWLLTTSASLVGAVILLWVIFVVVLLLVKPDGTTIKDVLRLLPDLLRLVKRLAGDRGLPRGVRVRLWLLLVYLASPIDLVPDFIPVIGYADDAVIVALVLRSVTRRAGPQALARHWPGTDEGLLTLCRLVGLPPP